MSLNAPPPTLPNFMNSHSRRIWEDCSRRAQHVDLMMKCPNLTATQVRALTEQAQGILDYVRNNSRLPRTWGPEEVTYVALEYGTGDDCGWSACFFTSLKKELSRKLLRRSTPYYQMVYLSSNYREIDADFGFEIAKMLLPDDDYGPHAIDMFVLYRGKDLTCEEYMELKGDQF